LLGFFVHFLLGRVAPLEAGAEVLKSAALFFRRASPVKIALRWVECGVHLE
jgi:hypothetical protein